MSTTNKILLKVVMVLVIVLAGIISWQYFVSSSYYAVYMRTGDLYFGQLKKFPSFGLSHVYTLQVNAQNQQTPVSIQKFTNVFWGPSDFLRLNKDEVVWINKLKSDSQFVKIVTENPDLVPPAPATPTE